MLFRSVRAADSVEPFEQHRAGRAGSSQETAAFRSLHIGEGEQQMLGRDVLVAELLGFVLGAIENLIELARQRRLRIALLRGAGELPIQLGPQPVVDLLRQLCIATVDLGVVFLLSGLAAFFLQISMWLTLGAIGLGYWTIGTVLRGQSLGGALWSYCERRRPRTQPTAPELEAPEFPHLVVSEGQRISVSGSAPVDGERTRSARKASA